jgi:hypothetical protein
VLATHLCCYVPLFMIFKGYLDSNPESFELMVAHCAGFDEALEDSRL